MPSGSAGRGTTIRILLLDGTPEGLRLIDKSNWNGLAMMCSRSKYPAVRSREEFNLPGVYFLQGAPQSQIDSPTLYIGQADNVRERLDSHHRAKLFWTQLAVFTSRYGHLNKAHAQYLESQLIDLAQRAKRAEILNGNAPRQPFLSESDRFDSESFLDQVLLLCPILGLDYFEPAQAVRPHRTKTQRRSKPTTKPPPIVVPPLGPTEFFLFGPGARAIGREVDGGFEVLAGGVAREHFARTTPGWALRLREDLLKRGVLSRSAEGLILTRDYRFNAPSAAAAVMLGRSANGRVEWKDKEGRTLKSLQEMALREKSNG